MTGYIARLAEAHCLSASTLFGYELAPLVDNSYWQRKLPTVTKSSVLGYGFLAHTPALNGAGKIATEWVQVLETATMRSDLSRLTLLRWTDVLSNLHLLRPKRAWCPICYEERKIAGQIVYEPLIWCIDAVTACLVHRRRLQTTCHFCNRQSYALASKSRPGFCSACGKWLGRSSTLPFSADDALPDSEFDWQASVLSNVGDLLSAAPDLKYLPTKEAITRSLDVCIEREFEGSATILSRSASVPKQTISNW